jgi:hypothetical protein
MNSQNQHSGDGFDFEPVLQLGPAERIAAAIELLRERLADSGEDETGTEVVVPGGATEAELRELERQLGRPLPAEYRLLLSRHRYLVFGGGVHIGGVLRDDRLPVEHPRISTEHRDGQTDLVIGRYDLYADGDQLLLDLDDPSHPVRVYLHEEEGECDLLASSFSLAVWRFAVEGDD